MVWNMEEAGPVLLLLLILMLLMVVFGCMNYKLLLYLLLRLQALALFVVAVASPGFVCCCGCKPRLYLLLRLQAQALFVVAVASPGIDSDPAMNVHIVDMYPCTLM